MAFPGDYTLLRKIPIDATAVSGSNNDFTGLITESVFKLSKTFIFANTDNGGGDVRFSTDEAGLVQIPIEVVSWDTSGETCQLWYLADGVDDVSPTDLYIWGDNTGDSQPAVGAAFGRNAVWVDYEAVYHLEEDPSGSAPQMTDSTGNGNNGTSVGSMISGDSVAAQIENGLDFNGSNQSVDCGTGLAQMGTNPFTQSLWIKTTATGTKVASGRNVGNDHWLGVQSGKARFSAAGAGVNSTSTVNDGASHYISGAKIGTAARIRVDGVNEASGVFAANLLPTGIFSIGKFGATTFNIAATIDEVRYSITDISDDYVTSEYNNQNDPASFYLEPVEVSSGISITEETVNTNYTSLDPIISLTGLVAITESVVNTNYNALDATVILTGVVSITEQLVNTNYTSLDPIIDLTGLVDITENLVNTNYATFNPTISLTAGIIAITESLVNTDYAAPNPSILLTPEPIGIVSTVCFNGAIEQLVFNGFISQLVFNGQVEAIEFNGKIINKQFNGSIQTLIFNGDVKRLVFNGTIQTTC